MALRVDARAIGSLGPKAAAIGPRAAAWAAVGAVVLIAGLSGPNTAAYATTAAVYVLIGLSLNVILGYTGQLSLGHQGLMGAGALFAAYMSTKHGVPFPVAVAIGGVVGAAVALLIGFAALRIRGLYLALVTLVVGITLQGSLFEVPALTGGGAGEAANRPSILSSNDRYYFVCVGVCVAAMYLDSCLVRSKVGRAFAAIKEDERVASAFGVNVMGYKLLAFVLSGCIAGVAGGLFAFSTQQFNGNDFSFLLALTFVLMTVVGGAGSRTGVAIGAILFAILHSFLASFFLFKDFAGLFSTGLHNNILQFGPDFISAVLLLITFAINPRGLAQQIDPIVKWMSGGDFRFGGREPVSGQEMISARP